MLNGPVEGEGREGGNQGTPPPGGIPRGLGSMGGMGGAPPGTVSIPVSQQDKEAIDRVRKDNILVNLKGERWAELCGL